ncbi:MAG: EAL domain-containing protein [Candidatus Eremiobacteraeota bacterium]|nr:EAL domain-containing protein [Candidatus Eremiobacteraeota bacterium]
MKEQRWPTQTQAAAGAFLVVLVIAVLVQGYSSISGNLGRSESLEAAHAAAAKLAIDLGGNGHGVVSEAFGQDVAVMDTALEPLGRTQALARVDDLAAKRMLWGRTADAAGRRRLLTAMDSDVQASMLDLAGAVSAANASTRASIIRQQTAGAVLGLLLGVIAFLSYRRNRAAQQQHLKTVAEKNRSLENAQRLARIGNWTQTLTTGHITCSEELLRIFSTTRTQSVAGVLRRFDHPDDRDAIERAVARSLKHFEPYSIDHRIILRDGGVRYVHEQAEYTYDAEGRPYQLVGTILDITERKQAEEKLAFLAHHDALTGLPNRTLLADRLTQCIAQAKRSGRTVAVLFLDLDRFKTINDTLGHAAGDELLKEVAARLRQSIRAADTVARSGGDEFVLVLGDIVEQRHVVGVVRNIVGSLAQPFSVESRDLYITSSIGISLYPSDDADVDRLITNADAAMYQAKEKGRNNFVFYTPEIHKSAVRRLSLETDLRKAVEEGQFTLHYQPVIRLATSAIAGFEALVRWQHPSLGLVPPMDFIPLAEESGLIVPIGEWVMRTACAQHKEWKRLGYATERIAVNISARQLQQRNIAQSIGQVLAESGLSPQALEIEITESLLMKDMSRSLAILKQLRDMGIGISIDDFGTGYSSLGYLKLFPLDTLKIDKSFIRDLTVDRFDEAIASAVVTLAKSLSLNVIAEGVETADQAFKLQELGCDEVQGYLFSKPQTADGCAQLFMRDFGRDRATRTPAAIA